VIKVITKEWLDFRGEKLQVEPHDIEEVLRKIEERPKNVPLVGDFLANGKRIARIWRDSEGSWFQPAQAGSFYLLSTGAEFSGGLDNPLPLAWLAHTPETKAARFWAFKRPIGPGRGWEFEFEVPVWEILRGTET